MSESIRPALAYKRTRADVRRRLRRSVAGLVVGILLLAGFAVIVEVASVQNDQLVREGVTTTGVVRSLHHPPRGEGWARVAYTVEGRPFEGTVDLGSDLRHYSVGQTVTVRFDPREPTHMTIDGEDNQPIWSVYAMIFMLIVGVVAVVWSVLAIVAWRRCQRLLARNSWRRVHAEVTVDYSNKITARISDSRRGPADVYDAVAYSLAPYPPKWRTWPHGSTLLAGPDGRWLFLSAGDGGNVVQLRVPRRRRPPR